MANPAILIGLGGTGRWALTYLKDLLCATYGGKVPDEVKLLAFDTIVPESKATKEEQKILEEKKEAPIEVNGVQLIDNDEYFFLRGNIRPICEKIDSDAKSSSHLRNWLQAEYYLDNLPEAAFVLMAGAGQYRQFGRMGLFMDMQNLEGSTVYGNLRKAITEVNNKRGGRIVEIHIITSIVGGTGSGLFLDLALLTRRLARQIIGDGQFFLRGFIVLSDTYATVTPGLDITRPNTFAAMRELDRFMLAFREGYQVVYNPADANGAVTHDAKLFETCAMVNAIRPQNSLVSEFPWNGVYPSIADFLFCHIDEAMIGDIRQGWANAEHHSNQANDNLPVWEKQAFYNSFGAFTYIYPVEEIIESFTYRFLQPFLANHFLNQITQDESKRAFGLTKAGVSFEDVTDGFLQQPSQRTITSFLNFIRTMSTRNPEEDLPALSFEQLQPVFQLDLSSADATQEQTNRLIIQNRRLTTHAHTSEKYGDSLSEGCHRILNEVIRYKDEYLGKLVDPTHNIRQGGKFRELYESYHQYHTIWFEDSLRGEVLECLNQTTQQGSTIEVRCSKGLAYALNFVDTLIRRRLAPFVEVMESARRTTYRANLLDRINKEVQKHKQDMQDSKDTPWYRPIAYVKAKNDQTEYIRAEQRWIDYVCSEYIFFEIIATAQDFIQISRNMYDELMEWKQRLVDGVYAELINRSEQLNSNRMRLNQIVVREYLTAPAYENARYNELSTIASDVSNNIPPLEDLLDSFQWEKPGSESGLDLKLDDNSLSTGDIIRRLCERTHRYFQAMRDTRVIDRLMQKYSTGGALADAMAGKAGALITYDAAEVPEVSTRNTFMGLKEVGQPEPTRFRDGEGEEDENSVASRFPGVVGDEVKSLMDMTNPYVCILVNTIDAIPSTALQPYDQCLRFYRQRTDKSTLQLFPAEIHAARLEARLSEVGQPFRLFRPEVVIFLENLDMAEGFCFCYLLDLIRPVEETNTQGDRVLRYYFEYGQRFLLSSEDGRVGFELDSLMDAALAFVRRRDVADETKTFDLKFVNDAWRHRLEQLRPDRIKQISELSSRLSGDQLQSMTAHADQRIKDLAAVIQLLVKDEIKSLSSSIDERITRLLDNQKALDAFTLAFATEIVRPVEGRNELGERCYHYEFAFDGHAGQLTRQGSSDKPSAAIEASQAFVEASGRGDINISTVNQSCDRIIVERGGVISQIKYLENQKDKTLTPLLNHSDELVQTLGSLMEESIMGTIIAKQREIPALRKHLQYPDVMDAFSLAYISNLVRPTMDGNRYHYFLSIGENRLTEQGNAERELALLETSETFIDKVRTEQLDLQTVNARCAQILEQQGSIIHQTRFLSDNLESKTRDLVAYADSVEVQSLGELILTSASRRINAMLARLEPQTRTLLKKPRELSTFSLAYACGFIQSEQIPDEDGWPVAHYILKLEGQDYRLTEKGGKPAQPHLALPEAAAHFVTQLCDAVEPTKTFETRTINLKVGEFLRGKGVAPDVGAPSPSSGQARQYLSEQLNQISAEANSLSENLKEIGHEASIKAQKALIELLTLIAIEVSRYMERF